MSGLREEREVPEMVKASVEVRSGSARFRVGVQARTIREALDLVGGSHPGRACGVRFPTGAEQSFVRRISGAVGQPKRLAA